MGFLDFFFGNKNIPAVTSILPEAAKNEIISGRLPQLNTDNVFLESGEYCCYIDKSILLVDKIKKIHYHRGRSMHGLFKGTRVNWGTGRSKECVETEQFKAILYITNMRIILQCKDHGFDKKYSCLSAIKPYANGLELQYGNKTYSLVVPDGEIPYRVIKMIQQRGNTT